MSKHQLNPSDPLRVGTPASAGVPSGPSQVTFEPLEPRLLLSVSPTHHLIEADQPDDGVADEFRVVREGEALNVYINGDLSHSFQFETTSSLTISGSGDATLWTTESLDARLTGSGSASYYGNPRTDVSSSGSGKVKGLGDK